MAGRNVAVTTNATTGFSGGFTNGVVSRIEAEAYKMLYDEGILGTLLKPIGQGSKGSGLIYPYFDPTNITASYGALTEGTDMTTVVGISNASVIVVASELGLMSLVTDNIKEDGKMDVAGEVSRQQGIACGVALNKHCLGRMALGVTTGTLTGTNSTDGFTFAKYAAGKARLRAKAATVPGRLTAYVPEASWYYTAKSTFSQNQVTYGGAGTMGNVGDNVVSGYYVSTLFGDIDVYRMTNAYYTSTATTGTLETGWLFNREGIGIWKPRDYRLERQRDASARGTELVSTFRVGAKVLISGYVQRLRMNSLLPS